MSALKSLSERRSFDVVSLVSLALPFVLMIMFTDGLVNPLPTFHGTDEKVYHYPTIRKFAAELPTVKLEDYRSATTPLFHLVFAALGKVTGYELPTLRIFNMLFSYMAIVMFYFLLINRFSIQKETALFFSRHFWAVTVFLWHLLYVIYRQLRRATIYLYNLSLAKI